MQIDVNKLQWPVEETKRLLVLWSEMQKQLEGVARMYCIHLRKKINRNQRPLCESTKKGGKNQQHQPGFLFVWVVRVNLHQQHKSVVNSPGGCVPSPRLESEELSGNSQLRPLQQGNSWGGRGSGVSKRWAKPSKKKLSEGVGRGEPLATAKEDVTRAAGVSAD